MGIDLYAQMESPACRAVLMTAKLINVDLNLKLFDLSKGEHLSNEEFTKLTPQKLVPTINDNGFVLWERYLVRKYAANDNLYPRDARIRAKVDQMLDFDIGTIFNELCLFLGPLIHGKPIDFEHEAKFFKALTLLDTFVNENKFVACDKLTIADISLIAGLSFAEASEIDFSKYSNVVQWMKRVKTSITCYDEINTTAMHNFTQMMRQFMKKDVK